MAVQKSYKNERVLACHLWDLVKGHEALNLDIQQKYQNYSALLPTWNGFLRQVYPIIPHEMPYRVLAVDGSQIYPDHHRGISCFVINIGSVDFSYSVTNNSSVQFDSYPLVFFKGDLAEEYAFDDNLVNGKRTELEWRTGLELMIKNNQQHNEHYPQLFLCDGSLIFWHLDGYEPAQKQRFLTSYIALLQQFYEQQILLAGYISMPHSKELVNILRFAVDHAYVPAYQDLTLEYVVDADIIAQTLQPAMRTLVFENHAKIVASYPVHLRPHFFYIQGGDEVVRVEIPAWIAIDNQKVETVSRIIFDQILKGQGYPVCLAEAHEQAVIKGSDREFFYQLMDKMAGNTIFSSLKSMKKRKMMY